MLLKSAFVKYINNLKICIPLVQQYYTGNIAYENSFKYTENVIFQCIYSIAL